MNHRTDLKRIPDSRGNLTVVEQGRDLCFAPRRVYWIYDVPGGERRYGHAYRRNRELIIALTGSFDVSVDDGVTRDTYTLNRSYCGVYVPAGTWREITNFSTGAIALVLASEPYDEADYIRDYGDFLAYAAAQAPNGETDGIDVPTVRGAEIGPDGARNTLADVQLLHPAIHRTQRQGNLCVVQGGDDVPFDLRRVFYLYDVPAGAARGEHAHRHDHQLIVAASGSFSVSVTDGTDACEYSLKRPFEVLHIPPGMWVQLHDFSGGAVALVICAGNYDPADYINDRTEYLAYKGIDS